MNCPDCKSFDIREDYNDGSHVCYDCGLVVSPFLIDERPIMDYRNVNYTYEDYSTNDSDMMNIGHHLLEIPTHIINDAIAMFKESSRQLHGSMKNALKAACVYTVCKRHGVFGLAKNHDDLCMVFESQPKHFAKALKVLESLSNPTPEPSLHHAYYKPILNMLNFNSVTIHKIYHKCLNLEQRLRHHRDFVNKKPCKLAPAIVYTIMYNNYPDGIIQMDLKQMAALSSVALPTLKGSIKAIMHIYNTNKNQH